ncbi:hydroxymethylbilane synthase [Rhodococcus aerolatus]
MLRIGTRGSALALTQAGTVRDALIAAGTPAELVVVRTAGDESSRPVAEIGVGVFTTALRDALAAGHVDAAVHSYKDLPTAPDPRLVIAAVPQRQDTRDALVARDGLVLGELPPGSRVGTSAPRRVAQILALGLGLELVPLRGNIDTRLAAVHPGGLDAVVLARAGLARLGRLDVVTESLEPVQVLPAPAQGALAVECRADDDAVRAALSGLDDAPSRATVDAERALLATLEAGCTAPVGALAEVVESLDDDGAVVEELSLRGCAAALDGSDVVRASAVGPLADAAVLGRAVAADLLDQGAAQLMAAPAAPETRTETSPTAPPDTAHHDGPEPHTRTAESLETKP